ncbi:MAG: hypothetical protein ACRD26_22260, partial [Vicinamibacterales bacterium]
ARARAATLLRSALTHPLVMQMKRPLQDLRWRVKGARLRNPPVPERVEAVLFVCLGNICRSPFGALRAERLLEEAGRGDLLCTSAGIRPSQAARSPGEACAVARRYGLSLDRHVPQALTRGLVAAHDMVVVMEASQLEQVQAAYPELHDRVFLLPLYDDAARGDYERYNIADPFGQPLEAFETCYERMDRALRRWLQTVV